MEKRMKTESVMNSKIFVGMIMAGACTTVAQVWVMITPAVAEIQNQQRTDSQNIEYIRRQVDEIRKDLK